MDAALNEAILLFLEGGALEKIAIDGLLDADLVVGRGMDCGLRCFFPSLPETRCILGSMFRCGRRSH